MNWLMSEKATEGYSDKVYLDLVSKARGLNSEDSSLEDKISKMRNK
jgi:hypothetical protein